MKKSVGIIGAGFAGLSTAKIFKTFGFKVTILEKEAEVGGVWSASRRYPGLSTQNPRTTYELSDYPMPASYPEWPNGAQVQAYLQDYAQHFGIIQNTLLQTEVQKANYDPVARSWKLTIVSNQADQNSNAPRELAFDILIVCNGIFSIPFVPQYNGVEEFINAGGKICHTSEFNNVENAAGKHVLVVGYGKSSCDVANATAENSASTTLLARHLIWKMPKRIKNVLNFKYIFLTRLGEGLFKYIRVRGFDRFFHGVGLPVRNAMMRNMESVVEKQFKLRELGLHPNRPFETIARSTVSLVSDGFFEKVSEKRLSVRKETEISTLRPGEAVLSNGETIPADIVVCGTGWKQMVPFFDAEMTARVSDREGNFRLYRSMVPVEVPGLAFNGYNSSFFSQLSAETGALWLIEYFTGNLSLPSAEKMNADIDERLAWMEQRTDGKHSKGTNIIPFSIHQIDEFLEDIDLRLNVFKRFTQWFLPITGSDYKSLTPRLLARHARKEKNLSASGVSTST